MKNLFFLSLLLALNIFAFDEFLENVNYIDFSSGGPEGTIYLMRLVGADITDQDDKSSHLRITVPGGFVAFRFEITEDIVNFETPVKLIIKQLTSYSFNKPGYSPIEIYVNNDIAFFERYPGKWRKGGWDIQVYDISPYVKKGMNDLVIKLRSEARTHYWLKWIIIAY